MCDDMEGTSADIGHELGLSQFIISIDLLSGSKIKTTINEREVGPR